MNRLTHADAEQLDDHQPIRFELTEYNQQVSLTLLIANDEGETTLPLARYELNGSYDNYQNTLSNSPADLLRLIDETQHDLLLKNPPPSIMEAETATINYGLDDYRLEGYTNGLNSGSQIAHNETIYDLPKRPFKTFSDAYYRDGLSAVVEAEHPLLIGQPGEMINGPGDFVIREKGWIPHGSSYHQVSLGQTNDADDGLYVIVTTRAVDPDSGLVETNQPIAECATLKEAEQFQKWLIDDLEKSPVVTDNLCNDMFIYQFGNNGNGLDPQTYTGQHRLRDSLLPILKDQREGISAAESHMEPGYQVRTITDPAENGRDWIVLVCNGDWRGESELQLLAQPENPIESLFLLNTYEHALRGVNGAQAVLDESTLPAALPSNPDHYLAKKLPHDKPEGPNWNWLPQRNGEGIYIQVVHTSDDQFALATLGERSTDRQPTIQQQIIAPWDEVGDLSAELGRNWQGSYSKNMNEALAQTSSIYHRNNTDPFIGDSYLAEQPAVPDPVYMATLDTAGNEYVIYTHRDWQDIDQGKPAHTILNKYPANNNEPVLSIRLSDTAEPEMLEEYNRILFNQGPRQLVQTAASDQDFNLQRWSNEPTSGYQPISANEWLSDNDGETWQRVINFRPADGQAGHQVVQQETNLGADGVPIVSTQPIERFLNRADAVRFTRTFNNVPLDKDTLPPIQSEAPAASDGYEMDLN